MNTPTETNPTRWLWLVVGLNSLSLLAAAGMLLVAVCDRHGRAPVGFLFAVPLLLLQGIFGLLPALKFLRGGWLGVRGRRRMGWLVAAGPLVTIAAAILSLLGCGGC